MSKEQRKELIADLLKFVKRASEKDATPEEIAALPEVAAILTGDACWVITK